MGRHKTISDDEVLAVARGLFRERGHTASTRAIAEAAGVSETVLYQRFGTKNALFFAAMVPTAPDRRQLFGPAEPPADARAYLRSVVERMAGYFAEIVPLGVQVMTHPSFDPDSIAQAQPASASARLAEELATRLRHFERRGSIAAATSLAAARLLTSLAHDWALGQSLAGKGVRADRRQLLAMVDVVWGGLAPRPRRR
ncbi:MAG: helix-turn-helix domain-containing protein [Thermoanaerobaculia bacterium]